MNGLSGAIIQSLPSGVLTTVGVLFIWLRLKDISRDVRKLQDFCEKRRDWCIDHFESKS